jgi:hypothetical protein
MTLPHKRWLLLALACAALQCGASSQSHEGAGNWMHAPGGGFGVSEQGLLGLEMSIHYMLGTETSKVPAGEWLPGNLYLIGPELTIGTHLDHPGFWGQRIGLRQIWLYEGVMGATLTGGFENYTSDFGFDDTRWYVQGGPTFAGLISLEYGHGFPMTGAAERLNTDRIVLRLELNITALTKLFEHIPIS